MLIQGEEGYGSGSSLVTLYTYDLFNRLVQTEQGDTGTAYGYNAEDYRTLKAVNGEVVRYFYEGSRVTMEADQNGIVTAHNYYGQSLFARESRQGSVTETYGYLYNAHGDVTRLVDTGSGTVAVTYEYDAFGTLLAETGSADNSITYAGYQYDKETGLYYVNARYYDSTTARFLTEDTYTGQYNDPLSLNRYTYCHNNPIQYYDPSGHYIQQVWDKSSNIKYVDILDGVAKNVSFKPGDVRVEIPTIQAMLGAAGFFTGAATYNYDSKTAAAVQSFQGYFGLQATGMIDQRTYAAIIQAAQLKNSIKWKGSASLYRKEYTGAVLEKISDIKAGNADEIKSRRPITVVGDKSYDSQAVELSKAIVDYFNGAALAYTYGMLDGLSYLPGVGLLAGAGKIGMDTYLGLDSQAHAEEFALNVAANLVLLGSAKAAVKAAGKITDAVTAAKVAKADAVNKISGGNRFKMNLQFFAGKGGKNTTNVNSSISKDSRLVKEAQKMGQNERIQQEANDLVNQFISGNTNPGIGNKNLFMDVNYLRGRNGARVFFRNTKDGIEILAKSDKSNEQKVIKILEELYK